MTVSSNKVRISVTLTQEEYALIRRISELERRSISNVIGRCVSDCVKSYFVKNEKK